MANWNSVKVFWWIFRCVVGVVISIALPNKRMQQQQILTPPLFLFLSSAPRSDRRVRTHAIATHTSARRRRSEDERRAPTTVSPIDFLCSGWASLSLPQPQSRTIPATAVRHGKISSALCETRAVNHSGKSVRACSIYAAVSAQKKRRATNMMLTD